MGHTCGFVSFFSSYSHLLGDLNPLACPSIQAPPFITKHLSPRCWSLGWLSYVSSHHVLCWCLHLCVCASVLLHPLFPPALSLPIFILLSRTLPHSLGESPCVYRLCIIPAACAHPCVCPLMYVPTTLPLLFLFWGLWGFALPFSASHCVCVSACIQCVCMQEGHVSLRHCSRLPPSLSPSWALHLSACPSVHPDHAVALGRVCLSCLFSFPSPSFTPSTVP